MDRHSVILSGTMPATLTPKQSAFVREYLIDLNATQAAIRAGYSKKSANEFAGQLMAKPHIKAAVEAAIAKRAEKTEYDAEWVLKRLGLEADADLADRYDDDNNLKPVKDWPKIWRLGLVAGVEVDEIWDGYGEDRTQIGVTKKLRLSERRPRIELIGKHIRVNAFQETVNVNGLDTLGDRLERATQRLEQASKRNE